VVRDVARVQGKSYGLADRLSKMIPFEVGMTLEKAYEQEEILRDFLKVDEEAAEICGCAVGTIKSRVARGRVALEQLMSGGKLPSRRDDENTGHSPLHDIMGEVDDLSRGR
jgi:hypothetical protein